MSYFVDTNVLVYARDSAETNKQHRAHQWLEHLWKERTGRLSYQVLQEYYVTVTKKLSPGLTFADARDDVKTFTVWNPLAIDSKASDGAWSIQDRFGFSWWDSLIVAAAQILNCEFVLSEDLQHRQIIDGVTIVNPFKMEPN